MAGKFEVYQDRASYWRWRLKQSNGQVIATGEAHEKQAGAVRQCENVARAADGAKIEVIES